jgi:peptide/nickel transport system substrate-binding protein
MSAERVQPEQPLGAVRISRRDFLKISGAGLVGASLLGIAGCGGGGGGAQQGGGGGGAQGNSIVTGIDQEPAVLNRVLSEGQLAVTNDTTAGIVEAPLAIQPDLSYKPVLAEAMPELVSEDPMVVEYRLKEGLTWSDGEPLTSADAKWTFEQLVDPDNNIALRDGWEDISEFATPDERTVRMTFETPYAPWRDLLSDNFPIFPKHIYEGEDFNKALNNEIVGSGPFKFKEWKKGESLTVVRNENYWGEKAKLDSVTYRFITDTNTLITSLQAGEVQFINPPPDIGLQEKLEGVEGAEVAIGTGGVIWEAIHFQTENIPNLKLRQAIAYGINRQQILDQILKGVVEPLESVLMPEQTPFYTPAWEMYTHDPERARQLVNEAKAEGTSTTVEFSTTSDNALRETLQEIVQQQLKDVGITIQINNESATTYFSKTTVEGNFQMGEWAWLATPDPSLTSLFSANAIPPNGENYYRYKNEQATQWMEESDTTLDQARRAELLQQVQEQMAEDLPIYPMYQRPQYTAFVENLTGVEPNPSLAGPYWNMGEWSLQ